MRVVTGSAKGKPIITLDDLHLRPTTSRVKEAMFSIIQFDVANAVVLDLFSGSGQLGIEALSRGAKNCTFVDSSLKSHKIEIKNLKYTNLLQKAKVVLCDGIYFLKNTKYKYDIIFLDPPYYGDLLKTALDVIDSRLISSGLIICEHSKNFSAEDNFKNITLQKQYEYGKIKLTLYKNRC